MHGEKQKRFSKEKIPAEFLTVKYDVCHQISYLPVIIAE